MTNYERYKKELNEIWENGQQFAVVQNKLVPCDWDTRCDSCTLHYKGGDCAVARAKWLKEHNTIKASTLPVDTKVICSQTENSAKFRRHFAKLDNGNILCFREGATSWSTDMFIDKVRWSYVTLEDGTLVLPE